MKFGVDSEADFIVQYFRYLLSERNVFGKRHSCVVVLFVLAHPDLGRAPRVPGKDVSGSARKRVRMLLPEHVADPAARNDFQRPSALPNAKRYF